jgi:hypothetical protein
VATSFDLWYRECLYRGRRSERKKKQSSREQEKRNKKGNGEAVMTVILMVTMFAIFLTIDYLRKGKEVRQATEAEQEAASASPRLVPSFVAGFEMPDNRRYHQGYPATILLDGNSCGDERAGDSGHLEAAGRDCP